VPDHRHRYRPWHPGAFKVADGRAAEIMRDSPGNSGIFAGRRPDPSKVFDRLAVAMEKPWNDPPGLLFKLFCCVKLPLQDFAQVRREREVSPLSVFGLARL